MALSLKEIWEGVGEDTDAYLYVLEAIIAPETHYDDLEPDLKEIVDAYFGTNEEDDDAEVVEEPVAE